MTRFLLLPKQLIFGLCLLIFIPSITFSQSLRGTISDSDSGDPLAGALVRVIGTNLGAYTNADGSFRLEVKQNPPFDIQLAYIGYDTLVYTVKSLSKPLELVLEQDEVQMASVDIFAERRSKLQEDLALTVESIGIETMKNSSEASFYDELANLREVDLLTVSFGFKVVNTRGFNSSAPIRSLQLIDGFDNASPGLNYPVGNFVGIGDLDVEGVDLVIGASSAYFGPGAFNGVINMRSKNPFKYQGLELMIKGGERNYREVLFRYATTLGKKGKRKKWAFKINGAYSLIEDWNAVDYSPSRGAEEDSVGLDNPGGIDAVNIYGDETKGDFSSLFEQIPTRHPGLGVFYRTGYREEDIVDYGSYNLKTSAALHFKPKPNWEIALASNFGMGSTVMQLDNRLKLNDVWLIQNKIEVTYKDRFFLRAYHSEESAGRTYDIIGTAQILQSRWRGNSAWVDGYRNYWFRNIVPKVKALEGFPTLEPPLFEFDFDQANAVLAANQDSLSKWHGMARASQDGAMLMPGTPEYQEVFDDITGTPVSEGGTRLVDRSKLFHVHGEYRFKPGFLDEVVIGGNFRAYRPYSEGTIFSDTSGTIIRNSEYGIYTGAEKSILSDLVKLNFAARLDKNVNYGFLFSPAVSASYQFSENHSIRMSLSYALRNPTLIEQFYYFRVGDVFLLGNLNGYDNLVTLESFDDYRRSQTLDTTLWERFDEDPIVPEKNISSEIAYSGIFFGGRTAVNATYYISRYRDFIGFKIGLQVPNQPIVLLPRIFRFSANAKEITLTTGLSVNINHQINNWLGIKGNYSWNRILVDKDDPLIPAYNTPENKFNIGLSGRNMKIGGIKNWNWGLTFRWIEGYTFESSPQFSGRIPAQYFLSGQIGKDIPKIRSSFKIAGSNLLNRRQNGLYGAPVIGRFVYASWGFQLK